MKTKVTCWVKPWDGYFTILHVIFNKYENLFIFMFTYWSSSFQSYFSIVHHTDHCLKSSEILLSAFLIPYQHSQQLLQIQLSSHVLPKHSDFINYKITKLRWFEVKVFRFTSNVVSGCEGRHTGLVLSDNFKGFERVRIEKSYSTGVFSSSDPGSYLGWLMMLEMETISPRWWSVWSSDPASTLTLSTVSLKLTMQWAAVRTCCKLNK